MGRLRTHVRYIQSDGYASVYAPGHRSARSNGTVLQHRLLAEQTLGRRLPDNAVVHHFGGKLSRQLVLCENSAYHNLIEARFRAFLETGDCHKRKCTICQE